MKSDLILICNIYTTWIKSWHLLCDIHGNLLWITQWQPSNNYSEKWIWKLHIFVELVPKSVQELLQKLRHFQKLYILCPLWTCVTPKVAMRKINTSMNILKCKYIHFLPTYTNSTSELTLMCDNCNVQAPSHIMISTCKWNYQSALTSLKIKSDLTLMCDTCKSWVYLRDMWRSPFNKDCDSKKMSLVCHNQRSSLTYSIDLFGLDGSGLKTSRNSPYSSLPMRSEP